ncbi:uncharacterized protein LOC132390626, partial [Hypanus sabinus]|uniref:uncharacterized protein LOC132390626 n=1 Tax=Hypanus sabinus TaxID=79690 RepID=UPI0028C3EC90
AQLLFVVIGLTPLSKLVSSNNGCFSFLSSETQRIIDRLDNSETHMNEKHRKTGSRAPSRDHLTSTYTELNIRKGECLTNAQADGLDPTYTLLNFRQKELPFAKDEDPPISSGPGEMPVTAQAGAEKQEPEQNIENRMELKIYLLCFVTFALVAIVAGLSIYVSQTRQSLITSERNYRRLWEQHQEMNRTQRQCQQKVHELNSTLESRTSDNSRLDHPQRTCLSNLSELNRTHSDLRHRFNQLEMKNGNITRNIAQVCQYLNRRRDKTLSQDRIAVDCYFISTLETSYDEAKQNCSNSDSNLLEINSKAEEERGL